MLTKLAQEHPQRIQRARTHDAWSHIFAPYPTREDGRPRCFDPSDVTGYRDALERFGVAVIQIMTPSQCEETVAAMFEEINAAAQREGQRGGISPDDPATWSDDRWPARSRFLVSDPAFHPQAFANRFDDDLHHIFTALWGDPRLHVSIDNWGVTRGTQSIPIQDNAGQTTYVDQPRWGRPLTLHWDYNPWLFEKERTMGRRHGYQALVALNDHDEDNGCHLTLPGGARFLESWCQERVCPSSLGLKRRSHRPSPKDPICQYMQKIPLERGQMVLWSWGQLHGNTPNQSQRMRLVQFIRMFPAPEVDPFYEQHDRYAPSRVLKHHPDALRGHTLSQRERRLLGLETW